MKMKTYEIGSKFKATHSEHVISLVMVDSQRAMLIDMDTCNRWSDTMYPILSRPARVEFDPTLQSLEEYIAPKEKPDVISFYRYIRPFCPNENLYGTTLHFEVDYKNRSFSCGVAICNGQNFTKEHGRSASAADHAVKFNFPGLLDSKLDSAGFVDTIVDWLRGSDYNTAKSYLVNVKDKAHFESVRRYIVGMYESNWV